LCAAANAARARLHCNYLVHGDGARNLGVVVGKLHGKVNVELGKLGNAGVAVELLDLCSNMASMKNICQHRATRLALVIPPNPNTEARPAHLLRAKQVAAEPLARSAQRAASTFRGSSALTAECYAWRPNQARPESEYDARARLSSASPRAQEFIAPTLSPGPNQRRPPGFPRDANA